MSALQGDFDDPKNLLIVGLDEIPPALLEKVKDLEDPERVDPKKVRADLIASVARFGVRQPVTVKTFKFSSEKYRCVTNGRQRVMAARIANEKADPPIRVPYLVMPEEDSAVTVAVANSGVRAPTLREKINKAKELSGKGYSRKELALMFSNSNTGEPVTVQTIGNWLDGTKEKPNGESEPAKPRLRKRKEVEEALNEFGEDTKEGKLLRWFLGLIENFK